MRMTPLDIRVYTLLNMLGGALEVANKPSFVIK